MDMLQTKRAKFCIWLIKWKCRPHEDLCRIKVLEKTSICIFKSIKVPYITVWSFLFEIFGRSQGERKKGGERKSKRDCKREKEIDKSEKRDRGSGEETVPPFTKSH